MKLWDFLWDKLLLMLLHLSCMAATAAYLYLTGYPADCTVLLLACWGIVLLVWLVWEFCSRKRYFARLMGILDAVDRRCLLGELMPKSFRLEDELYRKMIRSSNKSVIETVRGVRGEQREYREFIESWVHEIKAPITAINLMCENHKTELTRSISNENKKVENFVDMALYYARSDEVYKDYIIKETDLQKVAAEVVAKNKYYMIQNRIQVEVSCTHTVYTDKKWISFILNQLILNSVKYKRETDAHIRIFTEAYEHGVKLFVEDNGIGIKQEELPRIFDKGFTGSNGRSHECSTGMGLYLCRKLCQKLGIAIGAESGESSGTTVTIEFPIGTYLSKL